MRILILFLAGVMLTGCGFEQVDEGFRGIKTTWGEVDKEAYKPGLHFYNPISSSIFEMSVREEKFEGKTMCFTKDTQTVNVKFVATYYPIAGKIVDIYSQFGEYWQDKIVSPAIIGTLKDSIGQYVADDLVAKREAVKDYTQKELEEALSKRNIVITRIDIINLDFREEYEKAVEAKVVAIQRAQEAKNMTVRVKEEAAQKVLQAEAEAKSMRIRSEALSQNKSLVDYEAVQKWNGELPRIIMGGNSTPFINLKDVMGK